MAGIRNILVAARNGIFTFRSALELTSKNITNAETEGYTRQTALLSPLPPSQIGVLFAGAKRERLAFLEKRMHEELQVFNDFSAQKDLIGRIEALFSENEEGGLLDPLDELFTSFEELSTNPEAPGLRQNVVLKAQSFTFRLKEVAESIANIRVETDKAIVQNIQEINSMLRQIATLNKKIAELEAGRENPNELKDQRDLLIRKLSELIDINTFETENGMINVYLRRGGHILVDKDRAYSFTVEIDPTNQARVIQPSHNLHKIKYIDGKGNVWDITPFITSGTIGGLLKVRDKISHEVILKLNTFARQIIKAFGSIQIQGVGISHAQELISTYKASDSFTPINSAGLPYSATVGSISIAVYDENGNLVSTFSIFYDPDVDGIANIASLINGAAGNLGYVSASITPDNKLKISASPGFRFDIYNDTGGLGVSLGIDSFITGANVFEIDVEQAFKENPLLLSSSSNPASPYSNDLALEFASLKTKKIDGARTLTDIYLDIQNEIGNLSSFVNTEVSARKLVVDTLEAEIQQRSGVSLDEEFIKTIEYQRAFEASARIVRISDEMLLTILGLAGGGG